MFLFLFHPFANNLNFFANNLDLFAINLDLFANNLDLFANSLDLFANNLDLFANNLDLFANILFKREGLKTVFYGQADHKGLKVESDNRRIYTFHFMDRTVLLMIKGVTVD